MTKILFIIASVVTAVAIFFGIQNRTTLIETRAAKDADNEKIKTEVAELEGVIAEVVTVQGDRKRAEDELAEQDELFKSAQRKLAERKSESEALDAQLKKYQDEFAVYKEQLDQLPPGVSLETLAEDINRLKQALAEKEADLEALEQEIEVMNQNHERVKEIEQEKIAFQERRTQSFDVNSLEATVTAVNRDWGFVLVNAGSEAGITPSTSLLVARNNLPIGKIRIISLEPQSLVADIDFDNEYNNTPILPCETVALAEPNQ
jgi:hypothetical protein